MGRVERRLSHPRQPVVPDVCLISRLKAHESTMQREVVELAVDLELSHSDCVTGESSSMRRRV